MLIVVSGLPGVGKSALAEALGARLGAPVLSVDPIEAAIWRAGVASSFETGVAAYEVAATLAEEQLRLGLTVIVDAVSSLEVGRAMWRRAADHCGSALRVIEVTCADPELHRRRLAERSRTIEGFPEPTWDDVLARQREWEPWPEERLVVDSLEELSANLERALAHVRG